MANIRSYSPTIKTLKEMGYTVTNREKRYIKENIQKYGSKKAIEIYTSNSSHIHIMKDIYEMLGTNDSKQVKWAQKRLADETFMKNISIAETYNIDKAFKQRFNSAYAYAMRSNWKENFKDSISKTLKDRIPAQTFNKILEAIDNLSPFESRDFIDELFATRKNFYKNRTVNIEEYKNLLKLLGLLHKTVHSNNKKWQEFASEINLNIID